MAEMIEATIEGVQHNVETGWFSVKTNRGKFDTKIQEKAEEAVALKGETVRLFFTTGQSSGRINPHTNRPYDPPRWYERADRVASGNGTPGIEQVGGGDGGGGGRRGLDRDEVWRICLSVGVKAAVDTLPLMPVEQRDFATQQAIASAWAKFLFFSVAPDPMGATPASFTSPPDPEQGFRPFAGVESGPGAYDEPGSYEQAPPHSDSDIPY
jgi:hypothetical protein